MKNTHYDVQTHIKDAYIYSFPTLPPTPDTFLSDFRSIPDFNTNHTNRLRVNYYCKYWGIVGENGTLKDSVKAYIDTSLQATGWYLTYKSYDTEKNLFDYISGAEYQQKDDSECLYFTIGLPAGYKEGNYNWTIYMSSRFPNNIPDTKFNPVAEKPDPNDFELYAYHGYGLLQNALARFSLSMIKGVDPKNVQIGHAMILGKTKAYTKDEFMDNIGPSLAIFFLLIFIAPQYRLITFIVDEKASRAREGMKIMGLKDAPYWLSWFIYYFSVCITISLISAMMLNAFLFKHSSFIFVFLFVFLYGMAIFSFSLLITSFLQRPRVASILATLIHFVSFFMTTPFADYGVNPNTKAIVSFVPNIGMALCIDAMAALESIGKGINADSIHHRIHNYEVWVAFRCWIIMFVFLGLLALYLDNVLPKEYGIRQPWYFFLSPKFWCGSGTGQQQAAGHEKLIEEDDDELNGSKKDFEAVPPALRELEKTDNCMKVRNLKKVYGNGKVAVKNVSLTMYNGQIFALLGHNGAGKTTTISILTGMYPSSGGTASCYGLDMFRDVDELRKNLGVCPQFDILFDLLTPREHLKLFCMFKGVDPSIVDDEIEKTLKDVDLVTKSNAFSKTLSGGQKRKLSVGIAMVGGSRLVLLDEPTSGMDLTARRKIWDMLKNNKQNRILILTTHFMDEADILGDRIAIMAGGLIKCCGSSLFLKKRFGVGYNLIIAKVNKDPNPEIDNFIMSKIPTAIKLSEVSSEVTYQIPQGESDKFENFFTELDASLGDLRIKSYGVGVTTLEEVFLRVGKDEEENEQAYEMTIKNLRKSITDEREHFREESKHGDNTLHGSLNDSNDDIKLIEDYSIAEQSEKDVFCLHFGALIVKRLLVSFRQPKTFLLEILIPILLIIIGLAFSNSPFFENPPQLTLNLANYPKNQTLYYMDMSTASDPDKALFNDYFDSTRWPNPKIKLDPTGATFSEKLENFENQVYDKHGYDEKIENSGNYIIHTLDTTNNIYKVIGMGNPYGRDTAAIYTQYLYNALLRVASGNKDLQFSTKVGAYPLTATAIAGAKAGSGSIVAFLFAIAFAMIPAGVASQIVNERETNVKHQQYISGANLSSYWLSNYFVDWIRSMISITVAIIFIYVFSVDLPDAWVLFLLFALAIHPFTYATSFYFKKENSAQTMTILFHVFVGGFISIAVLVLQSFDTTRDIGNAVRWIFKI